MSDKKQRGVIVDDHPLLRERLAQLIKPSVVLAGRSLSNCQAYLEFTIMLWRSDLGQRR
jgi:hypothetical protein